MTLAEFLLERITEDEEGAWADKDHFSEPGTRHMDRWVHRLMDQTLRECAAKRRIVRRHMTVETGIVTDLGGQDEVHYCAACGTDVDEGDCPDLMDLASVYADHPDFEEEWRA